MAKIKKIAVLTSGGDAPGMNAAIRAVVRAALHNQLEVFGIMYGYEGMITGEIIPLKSRDVSNIIHRGGTILGSARSATFKTPEGRRKAYENLMKHEIDALVVIGGDGTFRGAGIFSQEYDIPCVGIPGTIDNDMYGTDFTIGFDTALNTVVQALDKIKDTANSHRRVFLVEVMGRDAGYLALRSGVATGAEGILIPEVDGQIEELLDTLGHSPKTSRIVVVAEGETEGGIHQVAKQIKDKYPDFDIRVNVLGHMQRGGSPSAFDRFLASRLGVEAVQALLDNQRSIMIGFERHDVVHVPFNKTIKQKPLFNRDLMNVAHLLL